MEHDAESAAHSGGPEYGNATKTYTNSTAVAIILASEILERPWENDAESAAEIFAAALDPIFAQRSELESFCSGAANIEVIGRGSAYGAAIMSALCIREMSGFRAAAHTGAGFKHGPNLDVDGSHVAIIFALGRAAGWESNLWRNAIAGAEKSCSSLPKIVRQPRSFFLSAGCRS